MAYGFFGKILSKRDFVSKGLDKEILRPFETWLQSALAASQNQLGRDWANHYLVSPVWRIWFGREVLGRSVAGVIMPSLDSVGRYFPLALLYHSQEEELILPPTITPMEDWFSALEARVLATLEENTTVDVDNLVTGLEAPPALKTHDKGAERRTASATVWHGGGENQSLVAFMKACRAAEYMDAANGRTMIWADCGGDRGCTAFACSGMPDPYLYADMLDTSRAGNMEAEAAEQD